MNIPITILEQSFGLHVAVIIQNHTQMLQSKYQLSFSFPPNAVTVRNNFAGVPKVRWPRRVSHFPLNLKAARLRTTTSSGSSGGSSSGGAAFSCCNLNNDSYYRAEESTPVECVTRTPNPAFRCYSDRSLKLAYSKHVDTYRTWKIRRW